MSGPLHCEVLHAYFRMNLKKYTFLLKDSLIQDRDLRCAAKGGEVAIDIQQFGAFYCKIMSLHGLNIHQMCIVGLSETMTMKYYCVPFPVLAVSLSF